MTDFHPTTEPVTAWSDVESLAAATAYRLANAPLRSWPFHHIEIDGLLPDPLFEALRSADLTDLIVSRRATLATPPPQSNPARFFQRLTDGDGRPAFRDASILRITAETLGHPLVARAMIDRFRPIIVKRFGGRLPKLVSSIEYIEDRTGYELLPHTDVPQKLVTLLVYLADDAADETLGTSLCTPRLGLSFKSDVPTSRNYPREQTVEAYRVPYRPNRALVFAPTYNSLHGVGRVEEPKHPRRLLQCQVNAVVRPPRAPAPQEPS